jgi:geranylgeranyl reductase family protein
MMRRRRDREGFLCCDVLVIGLGPAGAMAARTAARRGAAVLAVERNLIGREPARCAEWAPLALAGLAHRLGAEVLRVSGLRTHLADGRIIDATSAGVMLDRPRFDAALAREAALAGARLLAPARLATLNAAARRARLADGREIAFGALVAADGPASSVAQSLGLAALECAVARQLRAPVAQNPPRSPEVFFASDYPGGYGWLFPKGDTALLGIGVARPAARRLAALVAALHGRLVETGRVGARVLQRSGGLIPVGGPRARLVHGAVAFAGDAAGLAHPVTGAGIHAAVLSGEWAGEAAARLAAGEAHALAAYAEEIATVFGPFLARGRAERARLAQGDAPFTARAASGFLGGHDARF